MKKKLICSLSLLLGLTGAACGTAAVVNTSVATKPMMEAVATSSHASELDLTTVEFSNTPVAGWGSVQRNKTCDGQAIVVNGVTYAKGFGTHLHNDATSTAADMDFDISTLATQYEFFGAGVAQPASGNNCVEFVVLVDGVVKDRIFWRKGFNDDNPLYIRASIKGGSTLTLRTLSCGFGYANGTSVWVDPILYNVDPNKAFASDILDRLNGTNDTGWSYLNGIGERPYLRSTLDSRVNGGRFSVFAPYGVPYKYTKGIGTQLKGTTYEAYAAAKTDETKFIKMDFDIKGRGYDYFNTAVGMFAGSGCYIDAWADGVEFYHSPLTDASNAGNILNIQIPENTEKFQLRVIAANGFADGLVDLLGACFYKSNEHLSYNYAEEVLPSESRFPVTHNQGPMGGSLVIRDSVLGADLAIEKGLYTHVGGSYTFPVAGIEYNTLSGKVGAVASETGHGENALQATFTYADTTTVVKTSPTFSYASSNIDFKFHFDPTNLLTIKLELVGTLACSASIINDPVLSDEATAMAAAKTWADDFNDKIGGVCVATGETPIADLTTKWGEVKTSYAALSAEAKAFLVEGEAYGDAKTSIDAALAKYDYVAAKYTSLENFLGRNAVTARIASETNEVVTSTCSIAIMVVTALSLIAVASLIVLKKRKVN